MTSNKPCRRKVSSNILNSSLKRRVPNWVRTDTGKVWKVMEFKSKEIFQVWKIMENELRYGKVVESVTADLEN